MLFNKKLKNILLICFAVNYIIIMFYSLFIYSSLSAVSCCIVYTIPCVVSALIYFSDLAENEKNIGITYLIGVINVSFQVFSKLFYISHLFSVFLILLIAVDLNPVVLAATWAVMNIYQIFIGLFFVNNVNIGIKEYMFCFFMFNCISAVAYFWCRTGKRQLEEYKEKCDEAMQANKAKSSFLANMSHEIRTPMNAIIGMSEIVLRGNLNSEQRRSIEDIRSSGESLLSIINNILDLSKIEEGKFEIIEDRYMLGSLINDVVSIINVRLMGKNILFKLNIDSTTPLELWGDEGRIKQILINVLSNAVKFTKEGYIKLSVTWRKCDEQTINLIMTVEDSGVGIRKEDIDKIFKNYDRVDTRKNRNIVGTGLGLPISKNLAEMMNGTIMVESEYGVGSTFKIILTQKLEDYLPIGKFDSNNYRKENYGDMVIAKRPEANILIVDDNKVNLQVAKGLLEPYDMKIDTAENGYDALSKIRKKDYNLILMDHMMPDIDGIDTTKIIRKLPGEKYKKLPIIALTANALIHAKQIFIDAGMNDFLAKPIDIYKLNIIIKKWIPTHEINTENVILDEKNYKDNIDIKGLDIETGIKNLGGNRENYNNVLKTYYEETSVNIDKAFELFNNNDLKNFKVIVHGIKGSSRIVGFSEISDKALALENAAKEENIDFISENINEFVLDVKYSLNQLKKYMFSEINDDKISKKQFDENDIILLKELKSAFEDYDIDKSEKIISQFEKYSYDDKTQRFIADLRKAADNINYDMGVDIISYYINNELR